MLTWPLSLLTRVPPNVKVLKLDFYIKLLLDVYNFWIGWEQLPSVQ